MTKAEIHDQIINCAYEPIIKDSVYNEGDKERFANVFRRALKGETITVGFFGGSITCGEVTSDHFKYGYCGRIFSWFENTFKNSTFKYLNVGISGTNSIYGVSRMRKQLLSEKPDIVFVDYIANDKDVDESKYSFEAIIRRLLKEDQQIAVLAASFWHKTENHFPTLKFYNIPTINYFNTMKTYVDDEMVKWEELWHDTIHPNETGHKYIATCITEYLNGILNNLDNIGSDIPSIPENLCFGNPAFMDADLLQSDEITPTFCQGFKEAKYQEFHEIKYFRYRTFECGEEGGIIEFEIDNLKTFSLMRIMNRNKKPAKIIIDGQIFIEDDPFFDRTWDYNNACPIFYGEIAKKRTVRIEATGNYIITGLITASK